MSDLAEAFGYKMAWLAIKDIDPRTAASGLGVEIPVPSTWAHAVAAAYSGGWLFTPSVDGWTLVASTRLGSKASDPTFPDWLRTLSVELGCVQYFCTSRVVELHAWAKASGGMLERAYAYLGEVGTALVDLGDLTEEEHLVREADARERDEEDVPAVGHSAGFTADDVTDDWFPDEESVLALASEWSVDPRDLDGAEIDGVPYVVSA